jgi:hypothetical protein
MDLRVRSAYAAHDSNKPTNLAHIMKRIPLQTACTLLASLVVCALFTSPKVFAQSDPDAPQIVSGPSTKNNMTGVNGKIFAMAAQADGKIVIGGEFISVNGKQRQNLARMNPDGSLDETFTPRFEDGVEGTVYALAIDESGRILVGGNFENAATRPVSYLARYLADGTLDPTLGQQQGVNGTVYALAALPGGGFAVGGQFTTAAGLERNNFAIYDASLKVATAVPQPSGSVRATAAMRSIVAAGGTFILPGSETQNILFAKP